MWALLAALALLLVLGQRHSLWGADEPREAEIARELHASGDWVVPRLNGTPFLEKPPLTHWAAALGFHIVGGVDERYARLPAPLWAAAGALAAFWLGTTLFGRRSGLVAAVVLTTSNEWLLESHMLLVDTALAAGVAMAFAAFWWGYSSGSWRLGYAATACAAGVAFLSKGPVGVVLPGAGIAAFLLWRRDWRQLGRLLHPVNVVLFLGLVTPWLVLLYSRGGSEAFHVLFWDNMVHRFVSSRADHAAPFWYYLKAIGSVLAPWTVFLPPAVWALARPGIGPDEPRRPGWQYLLASAAAPLVLLSASSGKRPCYLMPLLPVFAVIMAAWLEGHLSRVEPAWAEGWRRAGMAVLALLAPALWGVPVYCAVASGQGVTVAVAGLAAALAVAVAFFTGRLRSASLGLTAGGLGLVMCLALVVPPTVEALEARRGYHTLLDAIDREIGGGARLVGFRPGERERGVVAFHLRSTFPEISTRVELSDALADPANVVLISVQDAGALEASGGWPAAARIVARPAMRSRAQLLLRGPSREPASE